MRISIGVVYVWFGMLKFFPALSPAELLAERAIEMAFFNLVEGHVYILFLAGWEVMLGVAFLLNYKLKLMIPVMFWTYAMYHYASIYSTRGSIQFLSLWLNLNGTVHSKELCVGNSSIIFTKI